VNDGRRLVLLRHGRTTWNHTGRAQGHADVELDQVGAREAGAAAAYLSSLRPAALWSSDLARARQTCACLEQRTGLSAKYDERLRELDVGERQGLTFPEFAARWPEAHAAWLAGDEMALVPGAESSADARARMLSALREALDSLRSGETGIVVSHGGSLKIGLVALLGWPAEQARTLQGLDNCAWATVQELRPGGRLRLIHYNKSVRPGHDAPTVLSDDL
jgi:glucosyl-3-phosphoglycerate phosphatase